MSLTVGLVGVALTIFFGSSLGTASGYFGGMVDNVMQRIIELLMSFPTIPLWAAWRRRCRRTGPRLKRFFAITVILSLVGWTGLARQVRAKVLSYREMDYTIAARRRAAQTGASSLCTCCPTPPATSSSSPPCIPGMIRAETALSFLGLGIQPPMVSWGSLLQEAQNVSVILQYPWE